VFLKSLFIIYNLALIAVLAFQGVGAQSFAEKTFLALILVTGGYFLLHLLRRTPLGKVPGMGLLHSLTFLSSLLFTTFLLAGALYSAKSQQEYLFSLALTPLPLYFWLTLLSRFRRPEKNASTPLKQEKEEVEEKEEELYPTAAMLDKEEGRIEPINAEERVTEPNRRAFLKRAGGLGLGLLVYSLLNPRNAGAAFFGSVPGPGTVAIKDTNDVQIDPAEKYPTSGYGITEIDDAGAAFYYGFVEKTGKWYILKESDTTGDLSYVYATPDNNPGVVDFTTAWTNHTTTLTYNRFDTAF